jgi:hypothetical protein
MLKFILDFRVGFLLYAQNLGLILGRKMTGINFRVVWEDAKMALLGLKTITRH